MSSSPWPPSPSTLLLSFTVLLTLVLVTVMVLAAVDVWRRQQQFTRERFAFAALRANLLGLVLLVESVAGEGILLRLGVQIFNALAGAHVEVPEPSYIPGLVVLLGLVLGVYFSVNVFRSWDGGRSVAAQAGPERPNPGPAELLREAVRYIRVRESKQPAPPSAACFPVELKSLASRPWFERARQLLELKSVSYHFDTYHDRDAFWRGTTKDRNTTFFLLCVDSTPDEARLGEFLRRTREHAVARCEYLVAIVRGRPSERQRIIDGQTIEQSSEAQLLDDIEVFPAYKREVERRVQLILDPHEWMLRDVYVDRKVNQGTPLDACVRGWLNEHGDRQLALLGDYGAGKTSAALMLCYRLLNEPNPARVPILLELRGQSPRTLKHGDLLTLWCERYGVNPRALQLLHESGRLLLIFEGLDELDLAGDKNLRRDHMTALFRYVYKGGRSKVLFTTRPTFALTEAELGAPEYSSILKLDPFTIEDITGALCLCKYRDQIVAQAGVDKSLRELISRPFMLHVISDIWPFLPDAPPEPGAATTPPRKHVTAVAAMKLYVDRFFVREAVRDAEGQAEASRLTTAERRFFMRSIATSMTLNAASATNSIDSVQYDRLMEQLIRCIPEALEPHPASETVNDEPTGTLRGRMPEGPDGGATIKRLVLSRSMLVHDEGGGGRIKFSHKAFMEYLGAEARARYLSARSTGVATDHYPFVTNDLILGDIRDSWVVRWTAEILRDGAAKPDEPESTVCRRLYAMLVYPRGKVDDPAADGAEPALGGFMSIRARVNWFVMRFGARFWVCMVFVTLFVLFWVWGVVLDLNRYRAGVTPNKLFLMIGGMLFLVCFAAVSSRVSELQTTFQRAVVNLGSIAICIAAAVFTRWQFAVVMFVMLLPLLNYVHALQWMRVWARYCGHLNYSDEVMCAALGLPRLPWWARDVRRSPRAEPSL